MPASLRELYAAKLSKTAQETSDISRALYDQQFLQGTLTGAAVGSGAARNYLYGFTEGLTDVPFDTTPPINAKTLEGDLKGVLADSRSLHRSKDTDPKEYAEASSAIDLQAQNYKKIFDKLDAGTATKEEADELFKWIDEIPNPVGGFESAVADFASLTNPWSSDANVLDLMEKDFNKKKQDLKTKLQQKSYWLYGQQAAIKEAQLKGDANLFNDYNQLVEFNENFKPTKLNLTPFKGKEGKIETIFSANPYLKNIALAGLETFTPGTEEYKFSSDSSVMKGIESPDSFYKSMLEKEVTDYSRLASVSSVVSGLDLISGRFGKNVEGALESGLNAQKGIVSDALNKKAAYFGKIYEKAIKDGDEGLQKQASSAIQKIQSWFNVNEIKPKTESGFLNAAVRTLKTGTEAAIGATNSTVNFITRAEKSSAERFIDYGKTPIRVPLDINSDGIVNNLDQDAYGNYIFSDQFHYRGKDNEWKTNWAGLPEASARVIGQMVPTIAIAALTEGAALAILPEATALTQGVAAARNLNAVQKAALQLQKVNQAKLLGTELRLLDRAATMATVTASTYDMMLEQELMYTKDKNVAKSRALGRASIEGLTEMIGMPVFGIFRTGKFGIRTPEAVTRLANATLPGGLTRTPTIGLYLNNIWNVGKTVVGQSIAESFEEVAADLGNYMMTNYIKEADKGYVKEEEVSKESLINTFTEAFFTMLPFTGVTSGISAVGEYSKGNRLGAAQWTIANNPDQAISYIKSELDKGKIDQKEAQRRVNEVNKLSTILNGMEDIKGVKDLRTLLDDPEAQRRYFNALVHKSNLTEINYESLTPEQKEDLNRYNLNEVISEKGKAEMDRIKNKQVPRTPEQTARLEELKNKRDKTEEETSEFKKLSEQGTLNVRDAIILEQINKIAAKRTVDKSKLSEKDYQKFVDAGIIKQEDLTPKEEDLKEQIKRADATIYRNKELVSKYEKLSKEDKDKIITNLFEETYADVRNTMSPTQLASLSRETKNQVKLVSQFNTLNPLDLTLRQKLAEEADLRFAELTQVNEEGRTNLAQQLVDEDVSNLTVSEAINKNLFLEQEAKQGYIDKTTKEELKQIYLGRIAQNITAFNTATPEQQVEMLIDHFESSPIEQRFEYETTKNDWAVMRGEELIQANITEELFNNAQAEFYKRKGQNRAAGKTGESVSSTPTTDISQPIGAPEAAAVGNEEQYDLTGAVTIPQESALEQDKERDNRFDFAANSILEQMRAKGYTDFGRTIAATFTTSVTKDINRSGSNKATMSTHNKVTAVLEDIVLGKKTGAQGAAEIKAILDQEMPESDPKNEIYRNKAVFYAFVAESVHYMAEDGELSQSEIEDTLKSEDGLVAAEFDVTTTTDDNSSHESADLLEKERTLALQVAQVYSWVNPLRTAAFETNEAEVSDDPARLRNAEILNNVQESPNPERKVQVSSREFFYRQVLGNNYDAFVERLKAAIEAKDVSEKTLNELQAFFGGDFFATFPTATGEAELLYLINQKGKGFLFEPAAIVTFVVNGELEMFESNGKMYPFYANLTLAKHISSITKEVEGTQAREVPTVVRDFREANPEQFNAMVQSGLALLEDLKTQVTQNTNTRVVFEMDRVTMGNKIGARIADLSEVGGPMEITFKSKGTEDNGLSYPGVIGSGVALINNEPYLLFNKFVEEVGGMAEIEALAEIVFNPEVRSKFFDESQEVIDYFAKHYNIFAAGSRKLEFSVKNGELKMFAVSVEGNKKKFTPIATKEEFIAFMTKTDTPGIRYNISKKGLGTNTSMFTMKDGEVVETVMSYNEFVKRTHRVLTSTDNTLRNKQIVFNEVSLRENVVSKKPAAPTAPAPAASPVIAPKSQPQAKQEAKVLSKVPSAPLISPKSVQEVEAALTALDQKKLVPNPENEDFYIEVDEQGNRIPGTPEWSRASTIAGKFDGGKQHANRGTIIDSMLREFVSGNIESVEDLATIYENHPLKNETNPFSRKLMEDLFDIFSQVKESTDAAGIKLIPTTRTLWGEIDGELYAGTIDLLGIDKEGKVYIIDLKTSTGNRRDTSGRYYESNRKKDAIQQSAYGELLRQRTGITVSNLVIFPVQTPLNIIDGAAVYDSATPNKSEDNKFTLPVVIDTDIFPATPAVNVAPPSATVITPADILASNLTEAPAPVSDKKADIEKRRQEELFDILSEEDKQIALKIPEGDKRNKWVKTRVSKTTKGTDAIERHNAEDALNTSTDVATRIAAKRKLESNQPFNGGSISDINKVIFKIKNDDVLIGGEKLIKDYYDAELAALEDVSEEEYNNFIDKGIVSQDRINSIANKVKNKETLSQREIAIFNDKTSEINKRLTELAEQETKQQPKPVATPLSFPPTISYDTAARAMESVAKLLWEQLPKQYQGKVVKEEDGTSSYYVKGYEKFPNLETKISFMYKLDNGDVTELHKFMLEDLFPDVQQGDKIIPGKFELRSEDINLNSLEIKTTFTEDGVNKAAPFPLPVRESMDIPAFAGTFLNTLASKPGAVPPAITVQENKDAVGETIQETMQETAQEPKNVLTPENVFSQEQTNEAEDIQNNCTTTSNNPATLPKKARPTSRISSKNNKK